MEAGGPTRASAAEVRQALGRVHVALETALDGIARDLERVDGVVHSASAEMMTSFTALSELTGRQGAEVTTAMGMLRSLGGRPGGATTTARVDIEGFVDEARATTSWLTELVVTFAKQHMRVVYGVEDLVGELRRAFDLLPRSPSGTSATQGGPEAGLDPALSAHVFQAGALAAEVERDLVWLAEQDVGLERNVAFARNVCELLERVAALNGETVRLLGSIEHIGRSIDEHVSNAVRALQFEDLTTQISAASRARLEDVATSLATSMTAIEAGADPVEALRAVAVAFEARLDRLAERNPMPVSQDDVDAGDGVLF